MRNNKKNSEEVKKQILSLAGGRILKDGFQKISMDEIATDLRIGKKTLYKHFHSKEILLRAISVSCLRNVYSTIISIIQAKTNVVEKFISFSTIVEEHYRIFNENSLNKLRKYFRR